MERANVIFKYFQGKNELTPKDALYHKQLIELFAWMVEADQTKRDATQFLALTSSNEATVVAKQAGVVAGLEEIAYICKQRTDMLIDPKVTDGSLVSTDDILVTLRGKNADLLAYERLLLNILGRMSGIATYTHKLASTIKNKTMLAATRKTPWMPKTCLSQTMSQSMPMTT